MQKYRLLRDRLLSEVPAVRLIEAPVVSTDALASVHNRGYVDAVANGTLSASQVREIGFPWSLAMAERARRSVGATVAACRAALRDGVAGNLAGGTHHAGTGSGGGFCVFNDAAVAARQIQLEAGRAFCLAVIDLDVHQGNGTAQIFHGDPTVFTLSLHGEKNFPFRKEASDLDVGLPDGCGDAPYLAALDGALRELDARFRPNLLIYLAGADPLASDRLGRLSLSPEGLAARDQRVFDWAWQRRVPVAFTMAGGYGHNIDDTVAAQLTTWRIALACCEQWQNQRP